MDRTSDIGRNLVEIPAAFARSLACDFLSEINSKISTLSFPESRASIIDCASEPLPEANRTMRI
jgi:hypothetical protein